MSDEMLNDLRQAATPAPPKGFQPGVIFAGGRPETIITPPIPQLDGEDDWDQAIDDLGWRRFVPEGYTLQLVEATYAYSENVWKRDPEDRGKEHTAYTVPNQRWSYKFRVVLKSLRADPDIGKMMKEAAGRYRKRKPLAPYDPKSTAVTSLADFQVGKDDLLGGTPELLDRNAQAMAETERWLKSMRPAEILLVDPGDSTEGFNSAPNAERVNDLQETEAIRVWRRVFWAWIQMVGKFDVPTTVVSVPSNHCRNRRGRQNLGPADDDWGLEVLSQVHDMAQVNPEAYGHIDFIVPRKGDEHVVLTLAGGKTQAIIHGHQANTADLLPGLIKKHGRKELGQADIVLAGHFHNLRYYTFGDNQGLWISPTMDGGSSHYTPGSGESSRPGVLSYMVDQRGWRDPFISWT